MNNNIPIVLWCTLLILSGYYAITHINLETNILKLLPKYKSATTSSIIAKATSKINDKLIITVVHKSQQQARESFTEILSHFKNSDLFKTVKGAINPDEFQEFYQQFIKYRYLVMANSDREALKDKMNYQYFIDMAQVQLYGLTGFSQRQIKSDPLFFFNNIINQISAFNNQQIQSDDGLFYLEKNGLHHYFAFAQLKHSSYSPQYQIEITQLLESSKDYIGTDKGEFYAFGSILYAHSAYLQAKKEISTVGLGSMIGIIILFLLTFRSLLPLIVSVVCIALGLIFAFAVTSFVFNKVHLFALVFGSTITGVSIDYCLHYLCKSAIAPSKNIIKCILPGLVIGFASSAMVYMGFVVTGYSVLAQISLFSIVGLFAVLLNVLIIFPKIVSVRPISKAHFMLKISDKIVNNSATLLFNSPTKALVFFIIVFILSAVYLQPNDDVRALQSLSSKLKADENYIRDVMALKANGRYALIHAETIDELLEKEVEVLNQLKSQNQSIIGVSDLIPPLVLQRKYQDFYQAIYNSNEFKNYIESIGLEPDIITYQQHEVNKIKQIDDKIFDNTIIKNLLIQRWLGKVENIYALIVPLNNSSILTADEQVVIVQQAEDASKLFANFRVKSEFIVIVAALVLIFLLAFIRYGIKKSFHLVLIPLSAGLLSLLLTQLFGFHISLFSILALLLVLGMGLDYVVFLTETENPSHVAFALLLSSITTILSFGLLSLSSVAVIKSFGLTVALGILFILFISPAIINQRSH